MREWTGQATMVVSIDVTSADARMETVADACRRYAIGATWAVNHPAATDWAVGWAQKGHEVALLGDDGWVGTKVARTRFARHLAQRMEAAHDAGLQISTLVLRAAEIHRHLDLLVKHRISMVRTSEVVPVTRAIKPKNLRFGVWHAQPNLTVPGAGFWQPLTMRRTLHQTIQTKGLLHVVVDAAVVEPDSRHLRTLAWLFQWATQQRMRGDLQVLTLSQLASRLRPKQATPSRSILRRAA
jgi:hypothetical protein